MGTGMKASGLSLLVIVSMVVGGLITAQVVDDDSAATPATSTATPEVKVASEAVVQTSSDTATEEASAAALSASPDLPSLIEAVQDSVVSIELDGGSEASNGGEGSGFVLDTDGHILTNFHVVEGAQEIIVRLFDGSAADAVVLGVDPANDLAVIRVGFDPAQLQPITFGDSDGVRAGDPVFAIGSPFAKDFTVTSGIVSAVERVTQSSFTNRRILNVIQTDAALNPGNSGGPLFNAAGEVIGINSSITGPSGFRGSVGLGFAVPSNTAVRFLPAMIAGQEVVHSQLGVGGKDVDDLVAAERDLAVARGFRVTTVGGAALSAGVQVNDIITVIDGETIETFEDLAIQIDSFDAGDDVSLTIVRAGVEIIVTATLQAWRD